jgi:SAM-dependent methyltransferase
VVDINTQIWDALYESGNFLHYPSEVFVQLYYHTFGKLKQTGAFLDHGCGSGNNSEFLGRQGWHVTGTDVSVRALETGKQRLDKAGLASHQICLDPLLPLGKQLGWFDHVLCWDCLYYNRLEKAKQDAIYLSNSLASGGYIFVNMPTPKHEFVSSGLRLADGSVKNNRTGTRQEGALMAIPDDLEDFITWFPGLDVVEHGHFIFDFAGYREFMFIVARKPCST